MARLSCGVCFAPDPPPSCWVDLTKLAEAQGFEYAWLFDSHVLWQEVYPIFTLMAANTRTIKIGPCVTNPGTRDPTVTASALATLNEISGGRMVMGIGRGDSARRVLGQKPVTVEAMEADCRLIRDLAAGREVSYDGVKIRLKWAEQDLPKALTDYIKARDHYDYSEHAQRGAAHADFVPDDVIDRFCVIGTVEQSKKRIEELVDAGVDQFNLYLMVEKPEAVIKQYGEAIIPAFS